MKKLNIHNLKAKEIKKLHTWLRALIQILYFLFLPSVYTAAFAGVKYIFTQIGAGEVIGLTSFVTVLIVLCTYTIFSEDSSVDSHVHSEVLEMEFMHFISGALRRERKSRCCFQKRSQRS